MTNIHIPKLVTRKPEEDSHRKLSEGQSLSRKPSTSQHSQTQSPEKVDEPSQHAKFIYEAEKPRNIRIVDAFESSDVQVSEFTAGNRVMEKKNRGENKVIFDTELSVNKDAMKSLKYQTTSTGLGISKKSINVGSFNSQTERSFPKEKKVIAKQMSSFRLPIKPSKAKFSFNQMKSDFHIWTERSHPIKRAKFDESKKMASNAYLFPSGRKKSVASDGDAVNQQVKLQKIN